MANDYSSFMQRGEDGAVQSFDDAKFQSYVDSAISKGVTAFQEKFEKKQAEANMTDQQKFEQARQDLEKAKEDFARDMKAQRTEIVADKAKVKLQSASFSEKEIEILTKYVTDDEKSSFEMIDALITERQKLFEDNKKKVIENIQSRQPKSSTQANAEGNSTQVTAKKMTSQDIKNHYRK